MSDENLSYTYGENIAAIEQLYAQYCADPKSLDLSWQNFFEGFELASRLYQDIPKQTLQKQNVTNITLAQTSSPPPEPSEPYKTELIQKFIQAYRHYGHHVATVNPLKEVVALSPFEEQRLNIESLGFSKLQMTELFPTLGLLPQTQAPLSDILQTLQQIYVSYIGFECSDLQNLALEKFLQNKIESMKGRPNLSSTQKEQILQLIIKAELFESFLHTKYAGQKRFSIEGTETLIPMLQFLIQTGVEQEAREFVFGMAHRGRLNVLTHVLKKSYQTIFQEFESQLSNTPHGGSGDVKYHKGFSIETIIEEQKIILTLLPNPSHLEAIDPVLEGFVKARQDLAAKAHMPKNIVPVLIHGDTALTGQGVVYETLQLSKLPGYSTGGTIHIVVNNQVGFTAEPHESRSTHYCTDIARSFHFPVFHVNAEDPEGCIYAVQLAVEVRQKFQCDVFIELNGYRKYGHNEIDDPSFTLPHYYQLIQSKKTIRDIYKMALLQQRIFTKGDIIQQEEAILKQLQEIFDVVKSAKMPTSNIHTVVQQQDFAPIQLHARQWFESVSTGLSLVQIQDLAQKMYNIPAHFQLHKKLAALLEERKAALLNLTEERKVDWGMAEILAWASLLIQNIAVRLSGQDSKRGAFSHRQAVWVDQEQAYVYSPLNHLQEEQALFNAFNSPLSEFAVLGFEYGYSTANIEALVLWEAQFGDFCNGAQVIIDQFISSSQQKWGVTSSLVMLLPHGYEGQGPEHSSARIERFLQLAAEENMQIVVPSTPAQLFHLFRRQALRLWKKPLIIFTPKALLRYKQCLSSVKELSQSLFQEIIDDYQLAANVHRLLLCSGKIYYDLLAERQQRHIHSVAIIRIEQLYPLHIDQLRIIIKKYKNMTECFWVQEEPKNMGAWNYITTYLQVLLPTDILLQYIGRPSSASPACGSYEIHKVQQQQIVSQAFGNKPLQGYHFQQDILI